MIFGVILTFYIMPSISISGLGILKKIVLTSIGLSLMAFFYVQLFAEQKRLLPHLTIELDEVKYGWKYDLFIGIVSSIIAGGIVFLFATLLA
jgi:hypothetical protein